MPLNKIKNNNVLKKCLYKPNDAFWKGDNLNAHVMHQFENNNNFDLKKDPHVT